MENVITSSILYIIAFACGFIAMTMGAVSEKHHEPGYVVVGIVFILVCMFLTVIAGR